MPAAAVSVDVLVVGAGAGGLLAAARLAHQGYRTLVVERLGRVGGRASSRDVDGFTINNGATLAVNGTTLLVADRGITLGASNATIQVPNSGTTATIAGPITDNSSQYALNVTGAGLLAFRTLDGIGEAVRAVNADYAKHCRAAFEIAVEYFEATKVVASILERSGL